MEVNTTNNECESALLNVEKFLAADVRFPRNVFLGPWDDYFFFDSDRMFDRAFVDQVKILLSIERAVCACLLNLDITPNTVGRDRAFFINHNTAPSSYTDLLRGEHLGQGWIYDIGRFCCVSNLAQWVIYCERESEIAAIAVRSQLEHDHYRMLLSRFKAMRIVDAISKPVSYGFSPEALSPDWRDTLLLEYRGASGSGPRAPGKA